MDQAELLAVISGMYDKLVTDVAERVLVKIDAVIGQRFSDARAELEETIAARVAVDEDALDDRITTWAENNLDVESQMDRYMSHHFDLDDFDISTRIQDVLDEIDWKEKVSEVMSEARITFE